MCYRRPYRSGIVGHAKLRMQVTAGRSKITVDISAQSMDDKGVRDARNTLDPDTTTTTIGEVTTMPRGDTVQNTQQATETEEGLSMAAQARQIAKENPEFTKADVRKALIKKVGRDVPYGTVFAALRKADMPSGRANGATQGNGAIGPAIMLKLDDGTEISRNEYIRQLFVSGKSRGEICKELNVDYSTVWNATKKYVTDGAGRIIEGQDREAEEDDDEEEEDEDEEEEEDERDTSLIP